MVGLSLSKRSNLLMGIVWSAGGAVQWFSFCFFPVTRRRAVGGRDRVGLGRVASGLGSPLFRALDTSDPRGAVRLFADFGCRGSGS